MDVGGGHVANRDAPEADALDHAREVARSVAALHGAAPRPAAAALAATRDATERNWRLNEVAMTPFVGEVFDAATFESVGGAVPAVSRRTRRLFDTRVADGHVNGHGDLLAEDTFCLDDGSRILDCLAFRP